MHKYVLLTPILSLVPYTHWQIYELDDNKNDHPYRIVWQLEKWLQDVTECVNSKGKEGEEIRTGVSRKQKIALAVKEKKAESKNS